MIAFLTFLNISTGTGPASAAEARCGARNELGHVLEQRFGEVPIAIGLIDASTIIEVFARPDGETWTIAVSGAGGMSCILRTGTTWQPLRPKPDGAGAWALGRP